MYNTENILMQAIRKNLLFQLQCELIIVPAGK